MTALVTSVLLRPISAPNAITAPTTIQRSLGNAPITAGMTPTRMRLTAMTGQV